MSKTKNKRKENNGYHRQEVLNRGAAKIIGLALSHLYVKQQ
jgi:hypothetical protein